MDNSNSDLSDDEESNLDEANVKEKILSVISNTIETKLDKMIELSTMQHNKIARIESLIHTIIESNIASPSSLTVKSIRQSQSTLKNRSTSLIQQTSLSEDSFISDLNRVEPQ